MNPTSIAIRLEESVDRALAWLRKLGETQVRYRPAPDRWTIAEVMGHLLDSACNNQQRFVRVQALERLEFPKYDQNAWVERNGYNEQPWEDLVEHWRLANLQIANVMRRVSEEQLQKECTITPYDPCTFEFLMVDYVDHLEHHLQKIEERIAE